MAGMAARKALDRRPGPLPEITMEGDSVTFSFELAELTSSRLIVRCDGHGEVYACIADPPRRPSYPFTAGD
jgi:hypothetical protein